MKSKELFLISHAGRGTSLRGPTDVIIDNLLDLKKRFILIEHDLHGKGDTIVIQYSESGDKKTLEQVERNGGGLFRYFQDYRLNKKLFQTYKNVEKSSVLVCVNPLNALSGVMMRKKLLCDLCVFVSADYTKSRFGIKILDALYCWLDKYVCLHSDIICNVSTRIQALRRSFGLPDEKNLFFPNTPPRRVFDLYKNEEKENYTLVSVGSLSDQMSYQTMFDAMNKIKKNVPGVRLKVIGGGEKEGYFREYVKKNGLEKNVIFYGRLEHKKALKEIASSQIGLAMYSGKWSFNYYGDSMKIREYVGLGLPVITTDTHSTIDDIRKFSAGFIIEDNADLLVERVLDLFYKENYKNFSENAYKMSKCASSAYHEFFVNLFK